LGVVPQAREKMAGRMALSFVTPDYYTERPKPCMHGWGARSLTVNPFGYVLPCPTAGEIKELQFDNVRARSLDWIWLHSEAFNRFRGTDWMPDTCRQCPLHEIDFGGCRCQAALILGDPSAVDPACSLSPGRAELSRFVESQKFGEIDSVAEAIPDEIKFRTFTT
jgi:pyrroloquinoline quinone biosynthesis protein E